MTYRNCLPIAIGLCVLIFAGCRGPAGRRAPERVTYDDVPLGAVRNLTTDGRDFVGGVAEPAGLERLRDAHGVKTVIDLRKPEQKADGYEEMVRSKGLTYVAVPMNSEALTAEDAAAILRALEAHDNEPLFFECGSGNRAGAAYGLYCGLRLNRPVDEALRAAEQAGVRNEMLKRDLARYLEENARK